MLKHKYKNDNIEDFKFVTNYNDKNIDYIYNMKQYLNDNFSVKPLYSEQTLFCLSKSSLFDIADEYEDVLRKHIEQRNSERRTVIRIVLDEISSIFKEEN